MPRPSFPVVAHAPILVSRQTATFGSLAVDPEMQRLFALQPGADRLQAVGAESGSIRHILIGAPAGIAIDTPDNKIFVSSADSRMMALDRKSLARVDQIVIGAHAGSAVYDDRDHLVLIADQSRAEVWVIDARQHGLNGPAILDGVPGSLAYDNVTGRAYVSIPSRDRIDVIDPVARKVMAVWPLTGIASPRAIAADPETRLAFVAGANGVLAALDTRAGVMVSSVAIAPGVEQIAYDPSSQEVFCASGQAGQVSVVQIGRGGGTATVLGSIPTHPGARSLALSRSSYALDIWTAFPALDGSYVQRFSIPR